MAHRVKIVNGKAPSGGTGGVSDADLSAAIVDFFSKGVVTPTSYKVEEQSTPNMTVKVNTGNAYVPNSTGSMLYATELDAAANVTINANASGNPRITAIVIKVDTVTTPNNLANNIVSLVAVDGTPAASPAAPNDAAIQSSVGAGNAFYRLGNVTVPNGASSITNANIASTRAGVALRVTGGYLKYNLATSQLEFSNDGVTYSPLSGAAPSCKVVHSANQSLTTAVETVLAWDTEEIDTDTMHDNSTNNSRVTIRTAGKYLVTAQVQFATNGSGLRYAYFKKNGAAITSVGDFRQANGAGVTTVVVSTILDLAVNDYIEVVAAQTSGGALNVQGTSVIAASSFFAYKISN